MQEDIVKQMGYVALATRLKRISDKMSHSTRLMYKELAIDIEPNWYLVLILVRDRPGISVTKIAAALGFRHQSVVIMTNKMIQAGYLHAKRDKRDKRKSLLYLTGKAIDILPGLHKIWEVGEQVILELLNQDITIIGILDVLEQKLDKTSFGKRIMDTISTI
ncbi:MarR family transcriptional regulator [Fulvivirga sp. M361]|uniref:MarR family winged helix-turn-helix transcriptional regulator n=1 Tax=Fulvivirga sp. M361 TaxID=2594266 RepID=UPI00117A933A|nr:MarR family transcriptional regulator [Fulvivirga sp. M361]TRX56202.1 MarR family transcriptional regulator [Fulvivirga sp. M361]